MGKGAASMVKTMLLLRKEWVGVESVDRTCMEAYSKVENLSLLSLARKKCYSNVLQRRLNDLGGDTTHIDIVLSNLILSIIKCTKLKDV